MSDPVVTTRSGKLRGVLEPGGIVAFRGIPYAAPPVGPRRWKPPEPAAPWDGIRDAKSFGPSCPQVPSAGLLADMAGPEGESEDCLYLNVWTPGLDDAKRPVAVWIHGGAFMQGSGARPEGTTFARDGVVYVGINYRLGTLGFLHLDELFDGFEGTGSLGIADQIAALRWVHENIRAFGGDPDAVTIFGESAGGMSVGTLLAARSARGLFRRAIAQSGASHQTRAATGATIVARRACEILGVRPGDSEGLRGLSTEQLKAASIQMVLAEQQRIGDLLAEADPLGGLTFCPVVDGGLLDRRPIETVRSGSAGGVDLLVGICEDEWRLVIFGLGPEVAAMFPPPNLERLRAGTRKSGAELLAAYRALAPRKSDSDLYCDIQSDQLIGVPALRLADAQAPHGTVHRYLFGWRTPVLDGILGACHALEIPFVFDVLDACRPFVGEAPQSLADTMHAAWVEFMKTGRPAAPGLPPWPAYDPERRATMRFDESSKVVPDPDGPRIALWPDW